MATRGFEFAFDFNGGTPMVTDLVLGVSTAHKVGDIVLLQSDGYIDQVSSSVGEVTGVMMESVSSGAITAGTTEAKVAIVTPSQVWKCSTDSSTATTAKVGYIKTWDVADANTIDASDITNGSLTVFSVGKTDTDGNVLGYVTFSDTTFVRGVTDTDTT